MAVTLEALVERFEGLDQLTEAAFLELGGQVQAYYRQARAIAGDAAHVLNLLAGGDQGDTLSRLQLLVERCSLWLDEARAQNSHVIAVLADLEQRLSQLRITLDGLRKVAKALQALRVTTRIEASKTSGHSAVVMSQELGQLTQLIQTKINRIDEQVDKFIGMNRRAQQAEQQIQHGLLRTAAREVQAARVGLSRTLEQRIETSTHTEQLKSHTETIARAFGEMVAALQFQDITRQRLGHIQSALQDLVRQGEADRADRSGDQEAAAVVASVCRLQREQLEWAVNEFRDAAGSLTANLETMAATAVTMAVDTRSFRLAQSDDETQQSAAVATVLQSITACLQGIWETHGQASAAIRDVCVTIDEMVAMIAEIEFVSEEMQLLAMNAAVNAAHSSSRGGLEVIADNIQQLAEQAFRQSLALTADCRSITERAAGLDQFGQGDGEHEQDLRGLLEQSQLLLDSLKVNSAQLASSVGEVRSAAERLAGEIGQFVARVDIRDRFMAQVAPLLSELRCLGEPGGAAGAQRLTDELPEVLQGMRSRYTMMSERKIHQRFMASTGADQATDDADTAETGSDAAEDQGLGDNVELF